VDVPSFYETYTPMMEMQVKRGRNGENLFDPNPFSQTGVGKLGRIFFNQNIKRMNFRHPADTLNKTDVGLSNRHVILAICFETLKKFRASFVSISWSNPKN
jgi:hypothetical protein